MARRVFANKETRRAEMPAPGAAQAESADADETDAEKRMRADLQKWERAAAKRIVRGGKLDFESDAIPQTLKAAILGALESARDAATVKRIFADAVRWQGYP